MTVYTFVCRDLLQDQVNAITAAAAHLDSYLHHSIIMLMIQSMFIVCGQYLPYINSTLSLTIEHYHCTTVINVSMYECEREGYTYICIRG